MNINNLNNKKSYILNEVKKSFRKVKEENPLTYCITNSVTVNDCANAVLAIGGSPIIAYNEEEVEDIINIAKSLVINIGNPSKDEIKAMKKACYFANKKDIPIIFDPVGVGISKLRNELSLNLIQNYNINIIRGNMSEVKTIAKLFNLNSLKSDYSKSTQEYKQKGVDVNIEDIITKENILENGILVKELAKKLNTIIVASGPIDLISDGEIIITISNGNDMMPKITGSGCMLSTIIATYSGVNNPLISAIAASLHITIAGEKVGKYKKSTAELGLGTFHQYLIDYLYLLKENDISKNARIEIIE
ncbi:MAG: hydroxyethylthiazole kinase [archaeon]|nr:hydroxyethylthiazole kinase [archaeon]